jgi:hypothetical protein
MSIVLVMTIVVVMLLFLFTIKSGMLVACSLRLDFLYPMVH